MYIPSHFFFKNNVQIFVTTEKSYFNCNFTVKIDENGMKIIRWKKL